MGINAHRFGLVRSTKFGDLLKPSITYPSSFPMTKERIVVEVPSKVLHIERAQCPCGHSLMDPMVQINGFPSIKVLLKHGSKRGLVHLDPVYGSFLNQFEMDVPEDAVVDLFCPKCNTPLQIEGKHCEECYSPLFGLNLPNGGVLEGCLKGGCKRHSLKLVGQDIVAGNRQSADHIQLLL